MLANNSLPRLVSALKDWGTFHVDGTFSCFMDTFNLTKWICKGRVSVMDEIIFNLPEADVSCTLDIGLLASRWGVGTSIVQC